MDNSTAIVGIDVGKKKLDVALLVNGKIKSKVIDNSAAGHQVLLEWLDKTKLPKAALRVCMEATGVYFEEVATTLHDAGLAVSVVNPGCIKGFGQSENLRNKTDKADAALIARYCAAMAPATWAPAPLEQRQLRAWSQRILALKDMRQQERNRLESYEASGMGEVAEHARLLIAWFDTEIKQLEDDVDDHIDRHPGLKHDAQLITSIPGIGNTTAARILGQLGDIRRFGNAKALAAFLGVTPRQRSSGTSLRGRTIISRKGSASMRAALYMPGMVASRHNPLLHQFAQRLANNGMAKKAVIGAVMHKLVHLIYGVIRTGKPFDANYLSKGLAIQDGI
ncbi:IS110 family transposase [Duganella sp. P38]|uniref:IS110 family transposase n=1 Tax=Duganella sp. P38 TaxID=3423949 RepID=UPI003D7A0654